MLVSLSCIRLSHFLDTSLSLVIAHHGDELEIRTIPTIESAYRLEFDQSVWKKDSSEASSDAKNGTYTLLVSGKVQMVCVNRDMKVHCTPS